MSADNWGICPECNTARSQNIRTAEALVLAAYGTVPVDEYADLEARLANMRQTAPEHTLREDYGIFTDEDGVFSVAYSCTCRCGFSFNFAHAERAKTASAA